MSFRSFPAPRFMPHPDLEGAQGFVTLHVDLARVVKSYRPSLFAFEWLGTDGRVKDTDLLAPNFARARTQVESAWARGEALAQPILGIGLLGHVEIGAGRDVLMTLAAQGVDAIPVHVPITMAKEFDKMKVPPPRPGETGNVMVYILLAIVLLAALSYTIAGTMRSSGTSAISDNQASTLATEILTYAGHVKTAAAKLKLRGCTDAQISFENGVVAGYTNAGAPADESCHVFEPAGGTITWATPPAGMNDGTPWFYTGAAVVHNDHGVYSNNVAENAELAMMLFGLPQAVCTKVNARLGVTGIPVDDGAYSTMTKFTGTYSADEDINGLPEAAQPSPCSSPSTAQNFCGREAGCFKEESGSERYVFYQVLVKR